MLYIQYYVSRYSAVLAKFNSIPFIAQCCCTASLKAIQHGGVSVILNLVKFVFSAECQLPLCRQHFWKRTVLVAVERDRTSRLHHLHSLCVNYSFVSFRAFPYIKDTKNKPIAATRENGQISTARAGKHGYELWLLLCSVSRYWSSLCPTHFN